MTEDSSDERHAHSATASSVEARALFLERVEELERSCLSDPYDVLLTMMQADSFRTTVALQDKASRALGAAVQDFMTPTAVDKDLSLYLRQVRQLSTLVRLGTR